MPNKTGRGLTEHFGVPLSDVDIMSVSTSHALGTVGGMCVGTTEVRRKGSVGRG
jgi:serine palmitoyltransferase